jgi:hypothetical protein
MMFVFPATGYAQHTVNDIAKYGGWYKVKFEIFQSGNVVYSISQCYPDGDEYDVVGDEKEQLPLYLKVLSMAMLEATGIQNSFDFDDMKFEDEGYFMQLTAFSFTFMFDFSKFEAEILEEMGDEILNEYKNRKW